MNELNGKVAVITGGTRGLGLAIAQAFGAAGARVVVASRSTQSVDAAVRQLTVAGVQATGLPTDVGELAQVEALADHARASFGRIDIWVNNAGTAGPYGPTLGLTADAFHQVLQTNILGVYHGSRVAMRHFMPQHSGKLINLLGHGYKSPLPWQNAYGSSKNWVRVFTLALAAETKGSGVGVFAFSPGMVLTELLTDVEVVQGAEGRLRAFPTIVRMWAKPPEYAAAKAVWLASAATDNKTGLLVSLFSQWQMMSGALAEGVRTLLRRPASSPPIEITTIPSDLAQIR